MFEHRSVAAESDVNLAVLRAAWSVPCKAQSGQNLCCRGEEDTQGMTFQIDAVRDEFNAVSVDKEEALEKRLARLTRDRCTNYRKKVHNLQVQHACFSDQLRSMSC